MPQCNRCGKRGLFLKIDNDMGLCRSCKEDFREKSRVLTEKIVAAKNEATLSKEPDRIIELCDSIDFYGKQLVALQLDYTLQPGQELLDLMEAYKKVRQLAVKDVVKL